MQFGTRSIVFWWSASFVLIITMLVALSIGRYPMAISDVLRLLWDRATSGDGASDEVSRRVVELVRTPRVLLSSIVGAGLGVAGAALQGVFRNPLVAPDILGIAPGAAFGGAVAILLSGDPTLTILSAFVFGIVAILAVSVIGRFGGLGSTLTLVLAGVITGAFFSALVSLTTFIADVESELPAILYWLLGSFAGADFGKLGLALATVLPAVGLIYALRFRINVLALGDTEARGLGLAVAPLRWTVLVGVTVIVAGSVAVAGIVGWIGLVVPHLARLCVGPDHRLLLPASALVGAFLLVLIDTICRSATASEIPLSVLTAIVGAPIFVMALRRAGRLGWGHG
ncbi:MAG: iron chelate uptake ABC transporter family permease subunit [Thiobacillus sp.]|nr:iron chelate uptake ABC transporter family permease subunit [Thiobacillus sp.]